MASTESAVRASAGPTSIPSHRQYLTFVLGRETFAVAILGIREIIEYTAPTEVPMMPGHVRGVINLRGAVVPVVDLSARLGRSSTNVTKRTCIVIVELDVGGERQVLGVIVDSVTEVLEIAGADVEPPPSFGGTIRTEFIEGIGKVDGQFVVILNAERMLRIDELSALVAGAAA